MTLEKADEQKRVEGIGYSWALLGFNTLLMGQVAAKWQADLTHS